MNILEFKNGKVVAGSTPIELDFRLTGHEGAFALAIEFGVVTTAPTDFIPQLKVNIGNITNTAAVTLVDSVGVEVSSITTITSGTKYFLIPEIDASFSTMMVNFDYSFILDSSSVAYDLTIIAALNVKQ